MEGNFFVPSKIRVGFQERGDTYTGKLAYVIYFDEKGAIRKESSWLSWCDNKIPYIDFDNTPIPNFVLNKGVQRYGHWNSGRSMVRIYDPRDFEFEIDVDNLLGILAHSDVSKRDITEKCVYAWLNGKLVLLPTNSQDYQDSLAYTEKQNKKISVKELKLGHSYSYRKKNDVVIYLGHFPFFENKYSYYGSDTYTQASKGKKHVFASVRDDGRYDFVTPAPNTLAEDVTGECIANYADIVESFNKSISGTKIVGIHFVPGIGKFKKEEKFFIPSRTVSGMTYFGVSGHYLKENDKIQIKTADSWSRYSIGHYENVHASANDDFGYKSHYYYSYISENPFYTPEREQRGYYNQTPTIYPEKKSKEYADIEAYMLSKDYDMSAATGKQLTEALEFIGYGRIYLVGENGTEIPFNY